MREIFALKKLNALFILFGILGFAGASAAYASQQFSNKQDTGSVNGYSYYNRSYVDNTYDFAGSLAATTNGANAPVSYMGATGHLWKAGGGGTLCEVGGWTYNTTATFQWVAQTTFGAYCGAGNYWSSGFTRAYNGNGYNTYSTYESPQLPF